jgi:chromosome segregation ATPase
MSREINPGIFGDSYGGGQGSSPSFDPLLDSLSMIERRDSEPALDAMTEKIDKLKSEHDQVLKTLNLKSEKNLQKTTHLEERLTFIVNEINERLSYMASRMKDKSMSDTKIEALIERHNQIVQTFELRINQSQRVIENQALQLSTQQALIDDARRQIEKLKRL